MSELSIVQMWIILSVIALVFLSGLFWCFCCGTCVGRSLLQNMGLYRYARDGTDNRQWRHVPRYRHQNQQQEELWHLNTWPEEDEEEEEEYEEEGEYRV